MLGFSGIVLEVLQTELQSGHFAEDVFNLGRILDAGQLHVNAIDALLRDDGLRYTELVDAIAQRGDVLLQCVVLPRLHLGG